MQKLEKFTERQSAFLEYAEEWSMEFRQISLDISQRSVPAAQNRNDGPLLRRYPCQDQRRAARGGPPSTCATAHTGWGSCREIRRKTIEASGRSPRSARTIPACSEAG